MKKGKFNADIKTDDLYKFYKEKHGDKALDKKTWKSIWNKFIDVRMKMLIYDNLEFNFPHKMGFLRIKLSNNKIYRLDDNGDMIMRVDYGATNKKWRAMYPDKTYEEILEIKDKPYCYYTNELTDGRILQYMWDTLSHKILNRKVYRIKMIRKWKRAVPFKLKMTKKYEYYA